MRRNCGERDRAATEQWRNCGECGGAEMELLGLRAKEGSNQVELPPTLEFSKRWEAVNFLASPFNLRAIFLHRNVPHSV